MRRKRRPRRRGRGLVDAGEGSEREVVVLTVQRLGEVGEGLLLPPRRRGIPRLGRGRRTARRPFARPLPAEEDQLLPLDLGGVAGLPLAILPGAVLDRPFDVDLVALLAVLLGDVGQLGVLGVPEDHPVPLRLLLLLPALVLPAVARGHRQGGDLGSVGSAPHLRIGPQVPDESDLVQAPAHNDLPRTGALGQTDDIRIAMGYPGPTTRTTPSGAESCGRRAGTTVQDR